MNITINRILLNMVMLSIKWGKRVQPINYENVGLYCQKCGCFGHVLSACNFPSLKDKQKVGSPGIVKDSTMLGDPLTTPTGVEVVSKEENRSGKSSEESKEIGKVEEVDKLTKVVSVEAKKGVNMEKYPFRKEIYDLLMSLVMGGVTVNHALEEGEIGTPDGDPMEEDIIGNASTGGQVSLIRKPLETPSSLARK